MLLLLALVRSQKMAVNGSGFFFLQDISMVQVSPLKTSCLGQNAASELQGAIILMEGTSQMMTDAEAGR